MRKKLLLIMLVGVMMFSVACGEKEDVELEKPIEGVEEDVLKESDSVVNWFENYEGVDLEGNEVNSSIFAENELTLINGWASWCGPCVQEIPILDELSKEYEDKGVGIKGLVIEMDGAIPNIELSKKEEDVVVDLLEKLEAEYQQLLVSEDLLETDFAYVGVFPTTYFVDKDGKFVGQRIEGALSKDMWQEVIDERLEMVRDNE